MRLEGVPSNWLSRGCAGYDNWVVYALDGAMEVPIHGLASTRYTSKNWLCTLPRNCVPVVDGRSLIKAC